MAMHTLFVTIRNSTAEVFPSSKFFKPGNYSSAWQFLSLYFSLQYTLEFKLANLRRWDMPLANLYNNYEGIHNPAVNVVLNYPCQTTIDQEEGPCTYRFPRSYMPLGTCGASVALLSVVGFRLWASWIWQGQLLSIFVDLDAFYLKEREGGGSRGIILNRNFFSEEANLLQAITLLLSRKSHWFCVRWSGLTVKKLVYRPSCEKI